MFMGSRVDDALTLHYRRILDHGDRPTVGQVGYACRDCWQLELAAERDKRGVVWDDLDETEAFGSASTRST
jgi:hypothetical protein